MTPPELHRLILGPLHRTGIAYMITGGVAAIAYGEPRLTNDVDVVIDPRPGDARKFVEAFPASAYYVPPLEVLETEQRRTHLGHFNIIHHATGLRADLYVAGDDPLHAWAFERRHAEVVGGDNLWFAPIEYVIIRKLEYFAQGKSDRHLRDIAAMLRISGEAVNVAALERIIAERGLHAVWATAHGSRQASGPNRE